MSDFETEQERFWAGAFGDDYVNRSQGASSDRFTYRDVVARPSELRADRIGNRVWRERWSQPEGASKPSTGCGTNRSRDQRQGRSDPSRRGTIQVLEGSLLNTAPSAAADLALTCGVLIHVDPARLGTAYDQLAHGSRRYVAIAEYYNPVPTEVIYHGTVSGCISGISQASSSTRIPISR